ncbi:tetratricopeptide repeat protein [Shewanella sp. GXUN23E]|uniref:tetratricopeptide repeat protein n=1 Tax=Shewanella sp. GXUN23E TaxID=3422498 RepID=UPI003D7E82D5
MSVINQMLKDLESRQQQHQVTNLDNLSPASLPKPPQRRLLWVLLLVLILVAIGTGLYLWQEMARSLPQADKSQAEPLQTAVGAEAPVSQDLPAQSAPQPQLQRQSEAQPDSPLPIEQTDVQQQVARQVDDIKPVPGASEGHPTVTESLQAEPPVSSSSVAASGVARDAHPPQVHANTGGAGRQPAVTSASRTDVRDSKKADTPRAGSMAVTPVAMSGTELAQKRFELGDKAEQSGNFDQAAREYLKALEFNPALHTAREHLAAVYYGQGLMENAAQTLLQGIDVYPDYQHYRLLLARVYQAAGQLQAAYDNAAVMQASGVEAIEKWALLGDLAQALNRYDLAQQAYSQLLKLQPGSGRWLMARAYAIDSQGNYQEAAQEYQQALASAGLSDSAVAFIQQRLVQLGAVQ